MKNGLRVAAIFSDHMVLQRNKPVLVWGEGLDGTPILVEFAGLRAEGSVVDGLWNVELAPLAAGGPFELSVRCGGEQVKFTDVWVGDVWLAGGQSNMELGLGDCAEAAEALPVAADPQLRLLQVPRITFGQSPAPRMDWKLCTAEDAAGFSAVAYFFAKKLRTEIDVPIGLISCNWGGTSASAWMDVERLLGDPELRSYVDEFMDQVHSFDEASYQEIIRRYNDRIADYVRREREGASREELGYYPWPPPFHPHSFMRPGGLYQSMLRHVSPYPLKGFIYYQGEADADRSSIYAKLMESMIQNWREDWRDETLPFLFVQLPGFGCNEDPDGESWPLLREAQRQVADRKPHTYMIVSLDCGEELEIHPKQKRPIGERLALTALNRVYGLPVPYRGPRLAGQRIDGNQLILTYDQVEDGLQTSGTQQLSGFEVAGADGMFKKAEARISGNAKVVLQCGLVGQPEYFRYGWANWTDANLSNSIGLPAEPFRGQPV